ncbi:hypothetical protein AOXY_G15220 [Acipenser oxyrinchus oxyrinchus]|uniref:BLUF domain-containing protein n=1 Tax=Acipenser oxyrinchus oxyrinchus TaxID=40147 RepID=A0AAD8D9V8_ACIOX|nr:hypothetical protein AOXY_G15220 [Acipenser oxyrinchus oxyrinchus]
MLNKRCFLHRLVYVAKIKAGQAGMKDLAGYYEILFAVYHNTNMEGVTGLLLLYPSCIIHVLESSSEVLYSVLNDLSNMEKRSDSLLQDAKILVMSHDIPMRMFQVWGYRFLNNITLTSQEAAEQKQPVENLIPECLPLLYKLCVHFLKSSKRLSGQPRVICTCDISVEVLAL